jgi:hypothetical protein
VGLKPAEVESRDREFRFCGRRAGKNLSSG